jgi:ABC-type transport system involved in multi-copper enzyme maturation permease subunit
VAQLLPQELESRTIFTILSKPVRRWEFLLGKYCGVALLLAIVLALSSAVFAGMLWVTEQSQLSRLEEQYAEVVAAKPEEKARMIEEQRQIAAQIRTEAHDTRLIQAVVVLYAKLLIVAALGLLISTFSTSMIFTVVMTSMIYIAGHLIAPAKSAWLMPGSTDVGKAAFLGAISYLVPDFSAFNLIDAIVEGSEVTWAVTGRLLTYAGTYLAVVLLASCAIFSSREL